MTRPRTVKGVLKKALELIDQGWTTGQYVRGSTRLRYCALGAIHMAATGDANHGNSLAYRATGTLGKAIDTPFVAGWNDDNNKRTGKAGFAKAIGLA